MKKLILFSTTLALLSGNVLGKVYFCPDPERIESSRKTSTIKKEGIILGSKGNFGVGKMQNQGLMFDVGRTPGGTINELTEVSLIPSNKKNTLECTYHDKNQPNTTLATALTTIKADNCKISGYKDNDLVKIKCDNPQKCKIICDD
jgi:hypothetical protein